MTYRTAGNFADVFDQVVVDLRIHELSVALQLISGFRFLLFRLHGGHSDIHGDHFLFQICVLCFEILDFSLKLAASRFELCVLCAGLTKLLFDLIELLCESLNLRLRGLDFLALPRRLCDMLLVETRGRIKNLVKNMNISPSFLYFQVAQTQLFSRICSVRRMKTSDLYLGG